MRVAVLIVAAGRGRRFGNETPKQYLPIAGVSALRRCLETFLSLDLVSMVQPVIHADDEALFQTAVAGVGDSRLHQAVIGADTRAKSVTCGLRALKAHAPDYVLVHDAARPFVSSRLVQNIVSSLEDADAAFAALPLVDALWRSVDGAAIDPVARDGLWRAQTPQGFDFEKLLSAHLSYEGDAADDVAIARAMGMDVRIVLGHEDNFKVTSPGDLERAERIARQLDS